MNADSFGFSFEQAAQAALEQKLVNATAAIAEAEQRHRAAMAAVEQQLAERQAQYDIGLARATAAWDMVDEQLRAAAIEVERARRGQAASDAEAARLLRVHSELSSQLGKAEATRHTLEGGLADAEARVEAANARLEDQRRVAAENAVERQREFEAQLAKEADVLRLSRMETEARAADVERLTAREAELKDALAQLATTRDELTRRLAATEAAFDDAAARATRERLMASKRAAEREAELDGHISHERDARAALERELADAGQAARVAEERHESERVSAAARLAEVERHLNCELAMLAASRDSLIEQVQQTQAAHDRLQRDHESSLADVDRLARSEAALTSELDDTRTERERLEGRFAEAQRALGAAAAREIDLTASSDSLTAQVQELQAALDRLHRAHESSLADVDRLTRSEATLTSELGETRTDRDRLGSQLCETRGALEAALARETDLAASRDALTDEVQKIQAALDRLQDAHESSLADVDRLVRSVTALTSELVDTRAERECLGGQLSETRSALEAASARETDLSASLEREHSARTGLEQTLDELDRAARGARDQHETALAEARQTLTEQRAQFERELSTHAEERDRLEQRLHTTERDLAQVRGDYESSTVAIARLEAELAEKVAALAAETTALAAETTTRTGLETLLSEARAATAAAEQVCRDEREAFRARELELEANGEVQLAQERLEHETRAAEMERSARALTRERDTAQQSLATARQQFDEVRFENQRLFEQAAVAMFRCTRAGVLVTANRACITLVGRRAIEELGGSQFATAVFDAPNVLSWLVEQCVSARAKESVETVWRRKDGGRLFVRLSARSVSADAIEVIVEDLTRIRTLQERLGQAHRMEAVGRFASEVAVTCGTLLNDLQRKGRDWVARASMDADSRRHGEQLFDEVGRATGFVRQLGDCGDEQTRTPRIVDLMTVIHDLEPVLKRVAGGDVEILVRDTSLPLLLDVATEQVERLLVNVASYGRDRMPLGGRLHIELGTTVVDRHFAARHPNVRLGVHALITVTEIRRVTPADARPGASSRGAHSRKTTARPGLDFGTLQDLVSECGGHMWIQVQGRGEMVSKIRLPLVRPDDQAYSLATRAAGRERAATR